MNKYIDQFEEVLYNLGGYALIPADKRPTLTLSDGCEETKTTHIKSVVWVMETIHNDDFFFRIKCIDEEDEMWDLEEYLGEREQQLLLCCITIPILERKLKARMESNPTGIEYTMLLDHVQAKLDCTREEAQKWCSTWTYRQFAECLYA